MTDVKQQEPGRPSARQPMQLSNHSTSCHTHSHKLRGPVGAAFCAGGKSSYQL